MPLFKDIKAMPGIEPTTFASPVKCFNHSTPTPRFLSWWVFALDHIVRAWMSDIFFCVSSNHWNQNFVCLFCSGYFIAKCLLSHSWAYFFVWKHIFLAIWSKVYVAIVNIFTNATTSKRSTWLASCGDRTPVAAAIITARALDDFSVYPVLFRWSYFLSSYTSDFRWS